MVAAIPGSSPPLFVSYQVEQRRFALGSFASNPQEPEDNEGRPFPLDLPKGMRAVGLCRASAARTPLTPHVGELYTSLRFLQSSFKQKSILEGKTWMMGYNSRNPLYSTHRKMRERWAQVYRDWPVSSVFFYSVFSCSEGSFSGVVFLWKKWIEAFNKCIKSTVYRQSWVKHPVYCSSEHCYEHCFRTPRE